MARPLVCDYAPTNVAFTGVSDFASVRRFALSNPQERPP